MAIDDVVQGVKVDVSTEGTDDAKQKLSEVEQAISRLAQTAKNASGGGTGGSGAGIGNLTKAFGDLHAAGSQAFGSILNDTVSGNLTGLATLLGGQGGGVAVAVAKVAEKLYDFTMKADQAILTNASMAKEFGTTPEVMQGLSSGFVAAGVSAQGFQLLVNRMSRQVVIDHASMTKNIREDSDNQAEAALRVEKANRAIEQSFIDNANTQKHEALSARDTALDLAAAQEKLQESYGVPASAFAAQDKLRAQEEAQLHVDELQQKQADLQAKQQEEASERVLKAKELEIQKNKALEAQHEQELRSVPHITEELKRGAAAGQQTQDVADTDVNTLRKAAENMAAPGGQATGVGTLAQVMDLIHSKAIDSTQGLALIQSMMGQARAAGLGGLDPEKIKEQAELSGTDIIKQAQEHKDELSKYGFGPSREQTVNATAAETAQGRLGAEWGAIGNMFGSWASSHYVTPILQAAGDVTAQGMGAFTGKGTDMPWYQGFKDLFPYVFGPGSAQQRAEEQTPHEKDQQERSGADTTLGEAGDGAAKLILGAGGLVSMALLSVAQMIAGSMGGSHGQWRGGLIRFARGGRVRIPGFAGGGEGYDAIDEAHGAIQDAGYSPNAGGGSTRQQDLAEWQGGLIGFADGGDAAENWNANFHPQTHIDNLMAQINAMTDTDSDQFNFSASDDWRYLNSVQRAQIRNAYNKKIAQLQAQAAKKPRGMWTGGFIPGFDTGGDPNAKYAEMSSAEWSQAQWEQAQWGDTTPPNGGGGAGLRQGSGKPGKPSKPWWQQRDESAAASIDSLRNALSFQFWAGGLPGFATGSITGPGTGTSDSILARLSNGEFVMKAAAVRAYGTGLMHAINDMRVPPPKYEHGGMVPSSSLPHFAEGGGIGRPDSILNLHVGGEVFSGLKAPAAVADQLRKFAIGQQTTSTGRKPSWAGG